LIFLPSWVDVKVEELCQEVFLEEGTPGFSGALNFICQTIRRHIPEDYSANFKEIEINFKYTYVTHNYSVSALWPSS
jgi:hypothetical protein